jgi:hypothetical protein
VELDLDVVVRSVGVALLNMSFLAIILSQTIANDYNEYHTYGRDFWFIRKLLSDKRNRSIINLELR